MTTPPRHTPNRGPAQGAGPRRSGTTRTDYGPRVLAHMLRPERVGSLGPEAAVGEAGSASCGDLVRIGLLLEDGIVAAARFQAYGCPATIAGAAEVVARAEGRTVMDAARIAESEIADALELSPRKRACSNLAADALHSALEDAVRRGMALRPAGMEVDPSGVLVGMSGGVDSAVAALRLREAGHHVVGVTFRLWSDSVHGRGNTCCSPATVRRARRVAHDLAVPHLTVDLGHAFYRGVVEYFVAEYAGGHTPNPCARCNAGLRFHELASLADRLGVERVATGHYARAEGDPPRLLRGVDRSKDQSYVLAGVAPALLSRVVFPLGGLTKSEVRRAARDAGLEPRGYRESQEICFIPDDDYRRFLRERLGETPGSIVGADGTVLGRHRGLFNYTIGQRKGLGIAAAEPVYVVALRPQRNELVVGVACDLAVQGIVVSDVVRHAGSLPADAEAQLRSMGATVPVAVIDEGDTVRLEPREAAGGVAPGQVAVLYEGDLVLAAGTIACTWGEEGPMV
jgi:tRNA-specific 2-thiouridylase